MSDFNVINNRRKSRRPFTSIWDHMIKGVKQSKGLYLANCNYCSHYWKFGKPKKLYEHLVNNCKKCLKDIVLLYTTIVENEIGLENESSSSSSETEELPTKKSKQTTVSNFFKKKKLEKVKIYEIDRTMTKTFVMANIPFSVIKNPWFVNLIKILQPAYDVPSCQMLGGILLQAELARTNIKIENELSREENFTIGKNFYNCQIISINFLNYTLINYLYV